MNRANELFSLKSVIPQYETLYGKNLTLAQLVDISRVALKEIGNLNTERFSARGTICDFKLNLPCSVYLIKSVTTDETFNNDTLLRAGINSSNYYPTPGDYGKNLYFVPGGAEQHINIFDQYGQYLRRVDYGTEEWDFLNARKSTPIHITRYNDAVVGKPRGTYVNFKNIGEGELEFDITGICVEVIFDTILVDEEGLIKISEKEITAIAAFANFVDVQKKYFMKIVDASMLQVAKDISSRAIANARAGERISDNDRDILFSQMMTANRKQYSMPYRN